MTISKYIHSCLLVEKEDARILFDPGTFSFRDDLVYPQDFTNISAVCITHQHRDHVDVTALKIILANNKNIPVYTNIEVAHVLASEGITAVVFETGMRSVGSVILEAYTAVHEPLLTAVPHNTAYSIDKTFLHPGDSLDVSLHVLAGISVLALPIIAPWADKIRIADFGVSLQARHIIPIHDGFVKDFYQHTLHSELKSYMNRFGSVFHSLKNAGESVVV